MMLHKYQCLKQSHKSGNNNINNNHFLSIFPSYFSHFFISLHFFSPLFPYLSIPLSILVLHLVQVWVGQQDLVLVVVLGTGWILLQCINVSLISTCSTLSLSITWGQILHENCINRSTHGSAFVTSLLRHNTCMCQMVAFNPPIWTLILSTL